MKPLNALALLLACTTASLAASPGPVPTAGDAKVRPFGFSGYETRRIEEPQCADVPEQDRRQAGCVCSFGIRCVCRFRARQDTQGCVVEFDTEREEGRRLIRYNERVIEPLATISEKTLQRQTLEIPFGESRSVCREIIRCPLLKNDAGR